MKIFTLVWEGGNSVKFIGDLTLEEVYSIVQQLIIEQSKLEAIEEYKKSFENPKEKA